MQAVVVILVCPDQMELVVKNLPANAGDMRYGFNPWVREIL